MPVGQRVARRTEQARLRRHGRHHLLHRGRRLQRRVKGPGARAALRAQLGHTADAPNQPNDNFATPSQLDGPPDRPAARASRTTKEPASRTTPATPADTPSGSVDRAVRRHIHLHDRRLEVQHAARRLHRHRRRQLTQVRRQRRHAWNNLRSSVSFAATGGTTYSIALDGKKFDCSRRGLRQLHPHLVVAVGAPNAPRTTRSRAAAVAGASGSASGSSAARARSRASRTTPETPAAARSGTAGRLLRAARGHLNHGLGLRHAPRGLHRRSVGSLTARVARQGPERPRLRAMAGTTYQIAVDGTAGKA